MTISALHLLSSCILFETGEISIRSDSATDNSLTVTLRAPLNGDVYSDESAVRFEAEVNANDRSVDSLTFNWQSTVDGTLNLNGDWDGNIFVAETVLSEGQQTVRLVVEDETGQSAATEVTFTVQAENTAPTCELTAPFSDEMFLPSESIPFTGYAADSESAPQNLLATLTSDIEGLLGSPTINLDGQFVFEKKLNTVGIHTITLEIQDPEGANCQSLRTVEVQEAMTPRIIRPLDGSLLTGQQPFIFEGVIENINDISEINGVEWNSSQDSVIFSGLPNSDGQSVVAVPQLSFGTHQIQFVVESSNNVSQLDSVSITVNGYPIIESITLLPNNPRPNETLVCAVNAYDEDGGDIVLTFEFRNLSNGDVYPPDFNTASDASLDLSTKNVLPGAIIQCLVSAADEWGQEVTSTADVSVRDSSAPQDTEAQNR